MKPLRKAAALTPIDWEIWTSRWQSGRSVERMHRHMQCDRRDAELMLFGQRWGGCCWATAVGNGTMVRCCQRVRGEYAGWCGDRAVFDITKCA